jgi:hypothetical protein
MNKAFSVTPTAMALGHAGKHMRTETKVRIHDITSKSALCYESEYWIKNRSDPAKLEATQMRFLRPSLVITRLDDQRNPEQNDKGKFFPVPN